MIILSLTASVLRKWISTVGVLVAIVTPAATSAQGAADAANFTQAMANFYKHYPPGFSVKVRGPLELEIDTPKGPQLVYLQSVYVACLRDKSTCQDAARRQAEALYGFYSSPRQTITVGELRVTVRPQSYIEQMAQHSGSPIARPLAAGLWVIAVRDEPTTISTLSVHDLKSLSLDVDSALKAGEHNLEVRFRASLAEAARRTSSGVVGVKGDDYTASLLAFPDLFESLAEAFDGTLYVAAPSSNIVLYVDARRPDALAQLQRATNAEFALARRPIAQSVFAWTPSGWEIAAPVASKEAAKR
jgi:hypothetical protein